MEASGLDRLNQAAYDAMGLMSFYTIGDDEVARGPSAKARQRPELGKVHSDIERASSGPKSSSMTT